MSGCSHNLLFRTFWAAVLLLVGLGLEKAVAQSQGNVPKHGPPEELVFPSPIGAVTFPHALHVSDLGASCPDCHHPAAAPPLNTPHPQWLPKAGHQCLACHGKKETLASHFACGDCHSQPLPASHGVIPSRKVAIHLTCARCHELGTAQDASKACVHCHGGPKAAW